MNSDESSVPAWSVEMFQSLYDSPEELELKSKFVRDMDRSQNFQQVVSNALDENVKILAHIGTSFIREMAELQDGMKRVYREKFEGKKSIFIHPLKPPCYSIASISLAIFENFFLEKDTLYCIPSRQREDRCSSIELQWSLLRADEEDPNGQDVIHFAGSEVYQKRFKTKTGKVYPDYFNPKTKAIKWFNGCRFHHCDRCLKSKRKCKNVKGKNLVDVQHQFEEIRKQYPNQVQKECEIALECETRKSLKYVNKYSHVPVSRLQSRLAYRSGFTELLCNFYQKKTEDTVVELWDISSLYPFIGKTHKFSCGKFFVLTFRSIQKRVKVRKTGIYLDDKLVHGFVFARLIPPKKLDLPYLGFKMALGKSKNNKSEGDLHEKLYHSTARGQSIWKKEEHLTHPLCAQCIKIQPKKKCKHSDEKRAILSVLSTAEIEYCLELGYTLPRRFIYELWVYDEKNKKNLFQDYMKFMEVEKIKASKVPRKYVGREQEYCDEVNAQLKNVEPELQLKREDLKENNVRRSLIKSLCNNLFGRLGMTADGTYSTFVKNKDELSKYWKQMHLVNDINLYDDKLELIMQKPPPFFKSINTRTNVIVASEINSYAKIHVHRELMRLQKDERVVRILSVNCDAFLIERKRNAPPPFTGIPEIFGNYRNEFEDSEIVEFYGLNSRTYSLKLASGRCVTRAIGFDTTYSGCNLNFYTFRNMLLKKMIGQESTIKVAQKRTRNDIVKSSEFTFTSEISKKRKIEIGQNDITSKPWGYLDD